MKNFELEIFEDKMNNLDEEENIENSLEELLYLDENIFISKTHLEIFKYYYPLKKKKIIYLDKIKKIELLELNRINGKYKFFGLNWDFSWFHFDRKRPLKEKLIQINDGSFIKISITPEDPEKVFQILSNFIKKKN